MHCLIWWFRIKNVLGSTDDSQIWTQKAGTQLYLNSTKISHIRIFKLQWYRTLWGVKEHSPSFQLGAHLQPDCIGAPTSSPFSGLFERGRHHQRQCSQGDRVCANHCHYCGLSNTKNIQWLFILSRAPKTGKGRALTFLVFENCFSQSWDHISVQFWLKMAGKINK